MDESEFTDGKSCLLMFMYTIVFCYLAEASLYDLISEYQQISGRESDDQMIDSLSK